MAYIYDTRNFEVVAADRPLVCRSDGGHALILPKMKGIKQLYDLEQSQRHELIDLVSYTGKAMEEVLIRSGIPIVNSNPQKNGNWSVDESDGPRFSVHVFGRSRDSKKQPYNQALYLPDRKLFPEFYEGNLPLNELDIVGMRLRINSFIRYGL